MLRSPARSVPQAPSPCETAPLGRGRRSAAAALIHCSLLLSGCGLTGTGQRIVGPDGAKLPDDAVTILDRACAQEAETKTAGSIAGILSNLRPGSYRRAYAACVESKGLRVEGQSASAKPATPQSGQPASPKTTPSPTGAAKATEPAGTGSPPATQQSAPR